jgi:hypothetical protein
VQDVGNVTSFTLVNFEGNRDNVFFGVRAYDDDGFRSPVLTLKRNSCTLIAVDPAGPPMLCK